MNKPKGTKDIFGSRQEARSVVIEKLRFLSRIYNFKEIETPVFEKKEVFARSVGETSDIVSKEMFEFEDKKNRKMVLRPEGTAGVIRAVVENKLYTNTPLKLFYLGQMFRYENPQKGRQRQFTQYGVEFLSEKNPMKDAEIIIMANALLEALEIDFKLTINSIGDKETRDNYSNGLKKYFATYKNKLSKDSLSRLATNPMRILDDKEDSKKDFVINAPKIQEFYSEEAKQYYEQLKKILNLSNISFVENPILVRGLDYYTDTVFEFESVSNESGSQNTILAGGRYDNLVSNFGGPKLSGVGFAIGIERLVNEFLIYNSNNIYQKNIETYIITLDKKVSEYSFLVLQALRNFEISSELSSPTKLLKGLEKADKLGALLKIIVGEKELENNTVILKQSDFKKEIAFENLTEEVLKALRRKNDEIN